MNLLTPEPTCALKSLFYIQITLEYAPYDMQSLPCQEGRKHHFYYILSPTVHPNCWGFVNWGNIKGKS